MKIHRVFLLLSSIWELLRFLFLFLAVWVTFQQILETNRQAVYWLLLFGNGGLLVAAALLFLYTDPARFRVLLNLVRLGKVLGLFSALLLVILEPISTQLTSLPLKFLAYRIAPFSILLLVAVLDLVFLFLLFSYRIEGIQTEGKDNPSLPEYRETIVTKSSE